MTHVQTLRVLTGRIRGPRLSARRGNVRNGVQFHFTLMGASELTAFCTLRRAERHCRLIRLTPPIDALALR
jgi:hypothetical protein